MPNTVVIIPTYNNAGTIRLVVERVAKMHSDIIVVNDGCTDNTSKILDELVMSLGIICVSYTKNRGKGYALRKGFEKARALGYEYAITIDSDGQHTPEDIPHLIQAIAYDNGCGVLVVGSRNLHADDMPSRNTFANKFSNFWFHVQTGEFLPDTQTGFRLYTLRRLPNLHLLTSRYESELELLVFSAWKGVRMITVPVHVYYPPEGERVSHFRPFWDFFRISLLNTFLCLLSIIYGYPRKGLRKLCHKNKKLSIV